MFCVLVFRATLYFIILNFQIDHNNCDNCFEPEFTIIDDHDMQLPLHDRRNNIVLVRDITRIEQQ